MLEKIRALPNLAAIETYETLPPWNPECYINKFPVPEFHSEEEALAYKRLGSSPMTQDLFFSLNEGLNAALRLSQNESHRNDLCKVYGVVLDFDIHEMTMDWVLNRLNQVSTIYSPNYVNLTVRRGFRLVWEFSEPLLVPNQQVYENLMKLFIQQMGVANWIPGLDQQAALSHWQYYDRGRQWVIRHKNPIPIETAMGWLIQASEKSSWVSESTVDLLPEISKLVLERFPGRWEGPFVEGARGQRFWDPTANNPTAAIVRRNGMQCFTGGVPFKRWSEIFGQQAMEQLESSTAGKILSSFWYDGKIYYYLREKRYTKIYKSEDFTNLLAEGFKVAKDHIRGVRVKVEQFNRVDAAQPLHFLPKGVVKDMRGNRILNTSNLELMPPSQVSGGVDYGDGFPIFGAFLRELFKTPAQLAHFIGFISYFYKACYQKEKSKGQVSFIAGPAGVGKSFLVNAILGRIFDGTTSAGAYFINGDMYNANLYESNIWVLDDEIGSPNSQGMARYANLLKQIAANRSFIFRDMYTTGSTIEFYGRMFVTINEDFRSLEVLPDIDVNVKDKVNLYQCGATKTTPREVLQAFEQEGPFFCRYLLDYEIPASDQNARFGINSYLCDTLQRYSQAGSRRISFREIMTMLRNQLFMNRPASDKYLVLNTTEILQFMTSEDGIKNILHYAPFKGLTGLSRCLLAEDTRSPEIIPKDLGDRQVFIILRPGLTPEEALAAQLKAEGEIK